MTVAEAIKILETFPSNLPVFVSDDLEDGVNFAPRGVVRTELDHEDECDGDSQNCGCFSLKKSPQGDMVVFVMSHDLS